MWLWLIKLILPWFFRGVEAILDKRKARGDAWDAYVNFVQAFTPYLADSAKASKSYKAQIERVRKMRENKVAKQN